MTMSCNEDIKATARDWLLRSLETPTKDERAQFAAWYVADPRHAAAYERFESIWQDAATLEDLNSLIDPQPAREPWWRRVRASLVVHPLGWAASASLMLAIAAIGVWQHLRPDYYATGLAEVREIHLPEGSRVTLGEQSSLEVAFRLRERRVALTAGVALFSVTKNPSRPFVVRVGDKEVRVVGTKFEVRRDTDNVRISVVEGTVEVMQAPGLADSSGERVLTSGQEITIALFGAIPAAQPLPSGEPAAWHDGRLVYVDAPLRDIVADANRYSREPITIADEGVANIRVSVTYPSDRTMEMLTALSRSLSLEIEHPPSGGIVLKSKERSD